MAPLVIIDIKVGAAVIVDIIHFINILVSSSTHSSFSSCLFLSYYRRNQVCSLPLSIGRLPLRVLNLSNNKLTSLPVEIGYLTLLQDLVSKIS